MHFKYIPDRYYLGTRHNAFRFFSPRRFRSYQKLRKKVNSKGYSLLSYDQRRCIFVHVPKCAGVSINQSLFGNLGGGHITFDDYVRIFSPSEVMSYFKFAIVRNPWDRLVSSYHFLRQGGHCAEDQQWVLNNILRYSDFGSFVSDWLTKENIWSWHHFRPQYHYLLEKRGKISLDFVGRFENLESDFKHIATQLGLSCSLDSLNASTRQTYKNYYTQREIDIVAQVYAKDIRLLGYDY